MTDRALTRTGRVVDAIFGMKRNVVLIIMGATLLVGGGLWAKGAWSNYKEDLKLEGYNKAVAECSVETLKEELEAAQIESAKNFELYQDALSLSSQLADDLKDLGIFIGSIEEQTADLPSGDVSPKTQTFLFLLNERSKQVIEQERQDAED